MTLGELLRRRYGGALADAVLRATGLVAAVGIPLSLWVPDAGALVGFVLVTIWLNGPLAPFMPAAYEAVIMLFGQIYRPIGVAALAMAASLFVEFLNYHLHSRMLRVPSIARLGHGAWMRRVLALYRRNPFFAIWVCSWSPIPYWPVRFLSPAIGYPIGPHLLATFLGRFPRIWFFAALGRWWGIGMSWLLAFVLAMAVLGVGVWAARRLRAQPEAERAPMRVARSGSPRA